MHWRQGGLCGKIQKKCLILDEANIFLNNTSYKYICIHQWSGRPGFNPRSCHTKDFKKWYLIPPRLTLSNIRYVLRVKWSNPGKGVAPSATPWCSSYWKESLLVALDFSRQLYYSYLCSPKLYFLQANRQLLVCFSYFPSLNYKQGFGTFWEFIT